MTLRQATGTFAPTPPAPRLASRQALPVWRNSRCDWAVSSSLPSHPSRRAEWRRWAFAARRRASQRHKSPARRRRRVRSLDASPTRRTGCRWSASAFASPARRSAVKPADDGRYTIRGVTPGVATITFNRIGYEAQEGVGERRPGSDRRPRTRRFRRRRSRCPRSSSR